MKIFASLCAFALASVTALAQTPPGYFRQPAIHGDTIVFVAEGDLWRVPLLGGAAQRLTTHAAHESFPAISPDGKTLAFSARYEGPMEIYVMPMSGGAPKRLSYDGGANARVQGFTPDGKVLMSTTRLGGAPVTQMFAVDIASGTRTQIPLSEAAQGCYLGNTLFFSPLAPPADNVRQYKGGLAQKLWRFDTGAEAKPLTRDYAGTSAQPICLNNRVAFLSDRSGRMNVWSMLPDGSDVRAHTQHKEWDVRSARGHGTKIAYHVGADIRVLDMASGEDKLVPISLTSDFDHLRTRWIKNPLESQASLALSPTGDRVAVSARGALNVFPVGQGRRVEITRDAKSRVQSSAFSSDGKSLVAISDHVGELELMQFSANGNDNGQLPKRLTQDAAPLRDLVLPSPDGKWLLHGNGSAVFYVLELATGINHTIQTDSAFDVEDFVWSPDSAWVAFTLDSRASGLSQIALLEVASRKVSIVTSNRYVSASPAFSPNGQWLYFISDRHLQSLVRTPWGPRNPEPFFDRQARVYACALNPQARWPFAARNELDAARAASASATPTSTPQPVQIAWDGLQNRLFEVPLVPGNYRGLKTDGARLYFLSFDTTLDRKASLRTLAIEPQTGAAGAGEVFFEDVRSYEMSADRKKILLRRANDVWVVDAGAKAPGPSDLGKFALNLRDFLLQLEPRDEWNQLFADAWRMHRDYFWDPAMQGADWLALRKKYEALLPRVTERSELDDLFAQMVSELATLHSQVGGGDFRMGADEVNVATLGAELRFTAHGYVVEKRFDGDPELMEERSPLSRAEANVAVGDTITHVNHLPLTEVHALEKALRGQVGKQVLLTVKAAGDAESSREVIVSPIGAQRDAQMRYLAWERERLQRVETAGQGKLGYVHLQAMRAPDIARWAREFYPVFARDGLILDLRFNEGGNIDSWIVEKLQRRAWSFWKPRRFDTVTWNQQQAFRGHVVVLVNGRTYSDGETLSEALKRLGIAAVIGTQTAGAGIWLSDRNVLNDGGIMRAAENGVFVSTPKENRWIIEGEGVTPDIVVENLPVETYNGRDAQLEAAIAYLQDKLKREPIHTPMIPSRPLRAR